MKRCIFTPSYLRSNRSPQDDQFVHFRIGEMPRHIQRLMIFSIKAVNIDDDVVFHNHNRMLYGIQITYSINRLFL